MNVISKFCVVFAMAVFAASAASAQDPVQERKALMKDGVAANIKLSAGMVKGDTPFDAAKASAAMKEAAEVPDKFVALLVEGTFTDKNDDTTAKPEAASDDFKKRMGEFEALLLAAADAAEAGEDQFKAAFGPVTQQCRSCHEVYRIKR